MSLRHWLSDQVFLLVVTDIDRKWSKRIYENLLIESGHFFIDELNDLDGLGQIFNKRDFIIETLGDIPDGDGLDFLNLLRERRALSTETLRALAMENVELGQTLAGDLVDPVAERSQLETALQNHSLEQVQEFLEQSLDNYIRENYESANAMTRTALEHMIEQIAIIISGKRGNENITQHNRYIRPTDSRRYLDTTGFLDGAETQLLNAFYGYGSTNGSHPGVSSEAEARLRRFICIGILLLFLEKLDNAVFMGGLV
jgi:hypothetical protein